MHLHRYFLFLALGCTLLPTGSSAAPAPVRQPPDPVIRSMVRSIAASALKRDDVRLVQFGTRNLYSETLTSGTRGVFAARNWIRAQLESIASSSGGRMSVALDEYTEPKGDRVVRDVRVSSVVATLRGDDPNAPVYLMASHYDSRNSDGEDPTRDAPGADDNASAVSAVIEAARVMAAHHFRSTIIFAAYDGEEQGLYGSAHHAKMLHDAGTVIGGVINNDIIGATTDYHGHTAPYDVRLESEALPLGAQRAAINRDGSENDSPSRDLARFVKAAGEAYVPSMHVDLIYLDDRRGRGGDQQSFEAQGYAGVRFVEMYEGWEHQHQNVRVENGVHYGDLPQYEDFNYLQRVTQLNVAALAALAMGPTPPTNVGEVNTSFCYDTELAWTAAPGAAAYEVVWRDTTSPTWQHAQNVGAVTHVKMSVLKDQHFFGVRSIDANGRRSIAVFPSMVRPKSLQGQPGPDSMCHHAF